MDASTKIAPRTARPASAPSPTTTPTPTTTNAPKAGKTSKPATSAAVLSRPATEPASRRDASDGVHAIGAPATSPDELRKVIQGIGGAARGVATAGSGIAQTIARGAPFKFGSVPGAAVLTGGLALYDTVREFQRSGFSDETARTAAGGIGGVAGAFKGGAIGASIGAFGGPIGAVVGGAAGAIIGGIAGSSIGQGVADGFAAARDVIRNAEVRDVGDAFEVAGEAAWEGAKVFGSTAWNGISGQVSDIAGGIADAAGWVGDVAGDVLDSITPW